LFDIHGFIFGSRNVWDSIYFAVVLVKLIKFDGFRAILIDEVEGIDDLFLWHGFIEFAHHFEELVFANFSIILFVKIIENFSECDFVFYDNFIESSEAVTNSLLYLF
jgi:hypothetical protein